MPRKRLPEQTLSAKLNGTQSVGRPQLRCRDYIENLVWNRLRFHSSEMRSVLAGKM